VARLRRGQRAAQRIEARGAQLALPRRRGLIADPLGQPADDGGHQEHHGERHDVLKVGDRELVVRRDEEEVEAEDRHDRGEERRYEAPAERDQDDPEEVGHDHVGELRAPEDQLPGKGREDRRRDGGAETRGDVGELLLAARGLLRARLAGHLLVTADHVDVDVAAHPHQRFEERTARPIAPRRVRRLADDDARDVPLPGQRDDLCRPVLAGQRHAVGAQRARELEVLGDARAIRRGQPQRRGGLHERGDPVGVQAGGKASGPAHEPRRSRARAHTDEDALAGSPGLLDAVRLAIPPHLRVDALRRDAQRKLAKRDEVPGAEEVLPGLLGLRGEVDLALLEAVEKILDRQVDEVHLVGAIEHRVRDGLLDDHVRDLGDHVVQALEVLDVERAVHVEAGIEEIFDVLPPLRVARPGRIRVCELVHEHDAGSPREARLDIELLQRDPAVLDPASRQDLEAEQQRPGVVTAVRLDEPDRHVAPVLALQPRRLEHRVGLADARRSAEEDRQLAALRLLLVLADSREQGVGVGTVTHHRPS